MAEVIDKKSLILRVPQYDPLNGLLDDVNSETARRIMVPLASLVADLILFADSKLTHRELQEALAVFDLAVYELQDICTGCEGEGCPACNQKGWTWRQE